MTLDQIHAAERYASRIRNKAKKTYAFCYLKSCREGGEFVEPTVTLGAMARQAVRMNIDAILT